MTTGNFKDHTQTEHDDEGDLGGFSAINNRTGTGKTESTIGLIKRAHSDGNLVGKSPLISLLSTDVNSVLRVVSF